MADFATTLKNVLNDGVKFVSKAAAGVASATRYKMNELDNVSHRREAISELGEKVYGLYQAGVELPEEVLPLVNEIRAIDEGLDAMRSNRAAEKAAAAEEKAAAKVARAEERAAAKAAAAEAKAAAAAAAAVEPAVAEAAPVEEVPTIEYTPEVEEPLTYTGEAPAIEVEAPAEEAAESEEEEPMMM